MNRRRDYLLIAIAFSCALGIFLYQRPFSALEGDDQNIARSVALYLGGFADFSGAYRFTSMPLVYYLTALFSKTFALDPGTALVILSFLGTVTALIFVFLLFRKTLKTSAGSLALALTVIPEFLASMSYGNDAAIALGFVSVAFYLLTIRPLNRQTSWKSLLMPTLFFIFSTFARFDTILLAPAWIFVAGLGSSDWLQPASRSFRRFVFPLKFLTAALVLVQIIFKFPLVDIARGYLHHVDVITHMTDKSALFESWNVVLPPLGWITLGLGYWALRAKKMTNFLVFVLISSIPFLIFYGGVLSTPKYLLPVLWVNWGVMAWALDEVAARLRPLNPRVLAALFLVPLFLPIPDAGRVYWTHDGPRLATGYVLLPKVFNQRRADIRDSARVKWEKTQKYLQNFGGTEAVIASERLFLDESEIQLELLAHDFIPFQSGIYWQKIIGSRILRVRVEQLRPEIKKYVLWKQD